DGGEAIPIMLARPAAAAFLARKLVRELVNDTPDDELVAEFAGVLRSEHFNIRAALRVLLASRAMFGPGAYRARISSPVEFIVGTAPALRMRIDMTAAAPGSGEMGQGLFEPPSVKGWEGGRTWINSSTMLVRMNAAAAACRPHDDGAGLDVKAVCAKGGLDNSTDAIAFFCNLLLDGRAPEAL